MNTGLTAVFSDAPWYKMHSCGLILAKPLPCPTLVQRIQISPLSQRDGESTSHVRPAGNGRFDASLQKNLRTSPVNAAARRACAVNISRSRRSNRPRRRILTLHPAETHVSPTQANSHPRAVSFPADIRGTRRLPNIRIRHTTRTILVRHIRAKCRARQSPRSRPHSIKASFLGHRRTPVRGSILDTSIRLRRRLRLPRARTMPLKGPTCSRPLHRRDIIPTMASTIPIRTRVTGDR